MLSIRERARLYKYGEKLGGWKLDGFLGEGSGGKTAVFRVCKSLGHFRDTRAMKAVEVIARDEEWADYIAEDRERYETQIAKRINRFLKEVEIMGRLEGSPNILSYDHNIIPVRWGEEENSTSFGCDLLIQMPLMDGSLDQLWKQPNWSCLDDTAIQVGIDICQALSHCHAAGIVHRDIKPENIYIPDEKTPRYLLGDFGISRIMADGSKDNAQKLSVRYAAPEQFRGTYDTRSDIYSLGLVLYALSNGGLLPFVRDMADESDVRRAIQRRTAGEPLPPPSQACEALSKAILKACAPASGERWGDAGAFRSALEEIHNMRPKGFRLKNVNSSLVAGIRSGQSPSRPTRQPDPYELRLKQYRAAAERGDPEGQYMVGLAYFWGLAGLSQDMETGAQWLLKAAQQGHRQAQDMISQCFRHGYGVEQNDTLATVWNQESKKPNVDANGRYIPIYTARSPIKQGKIFKVDFRALGKLGDPEFKDRAIPVKKFAQMGDREALELLKKQKQLPNQ